MSIYRIAKETGYSPSTVARALSGNGYCDSHTRDVIYAAAKKIGYQPNLSARALRNNKTERILFCIPDICNPFYFRMIQGASEVLEEHGYYAMLCNTEHSLDRELKMIGLLSQKYCDGMIIVSFDFCDENIGAIRATESPIVLTNRYDGQRDTDNFDYIYVDHIYGMELATRHLLQKGCRKILLITGDVQEQTSRERTEGYIKALTEEGLPFDARLVLNGNYTNEGAYRALTEYLDGGGMPDGIIASNDLAGYGVMRCCHERGIDIPGHVRLVSFDNTDYATAAQPSFTSVDMKQYEIGRNAATTLLERINGRSAVKNVILQPQLIERQSSK